MDKKYLSIIIGIIAIFIVVIFNKEPIKNTLLGGGLNNQKCSVSSTEVANIGKDIGSTILSANETRAWARIQQVANATNTIALSFDEGAAAVADQGSALTPATTTSPVPFVEFGRNAGFAYTGAVTGLADKGSTTVMVSECSY